MIKREYSRLIKSLFVFSVMLFVMLQSVEVRAERYQRTYQNRFVGAKSQVPSGFYDPQRKTSSKVLPEGAIFCDGKVVIAADVIKRQLSCTQKKLEKGYLALF